MDTVSTQSKQPSLQCPRLTVESCCLVFMLWPSGENAATFTPGFSAFYALREIFYLCQNMGKMCLLRPTQI